MRQAVEHLRRCGVEAERLEAEVLLAEVLGVPRTHLRAWPERTVAADSAARFERLVQRRVAGEPLAHILARREFWSLELEVTPDTLVPRPDTERLVELALELGPGPEGTVLDLGTGTGAIALALSHERPHWRITAVERSPAALSVARRNGGRLGAKQVQWVAGDWFSPLPSDAQFDLIVSNPPYIEATDPHLAHADLCAEPREALASGPDGLDALRRIIADAPTRLRPGAWLLLEHGFRQAAAVRALLEVAGLADIRTWQDLEGRDRVSGGRMLDS
ncbi:MAG: peptide chain release factor N(5)-glutamine methyltransferase [Gammaproteobacteria bacterium]